MKAAWSLPSLEQDCHAAGLLSWRRRCGDSHGAQAAEGRLCIEWCWAPRAESGQFACAKSQVKALSHTSRFLRRLSD
ncbi:MAG: hypothetical protein CMG98_11460 [Marinovum sp.]|nr:hypothetical protein [Marinovum sp.]